jgi:hypothetical protein
MIRGRKDLDVDTRLRHKNPAQMDFFKIKVEIIAALLDRLLHRCVVLSLDGESYRLRDHHAAADSLRRATTGTNR